MNIPENLLLGLGFLFIGLERFIPNIPPFIVGIIFLVLGLLILL